MVQARALMRLGDIAHARSGDKGSHANVGVIAYNQHGFEFLERELTATRVAEFFKPLGLRTVVRYPLPGIWAYNFLLVDILKGGASGCLRIDNQGKVLALALLELEIPRPSNAEAMLRPNMEQQT